MTMRKGRRATAFLMALLLTGILAVSGLGGTARAVTQEDIDVLKEKAEGYEAQKAEVQAKIDNLVVDKNNTLEKKAALDEQIMLTQQEIDNIERQIEMYEQLIADKSAEVEAAQAREDAQLEQYRERVRNMEENGNISYLAVLFEASSFSDFLSRLDFIHEVMNYDEELYQDYIEAKKETEAARQALEDSKAEEQVAKILEGVKKEELEEQVRAAEAYVAQLQKDIETQEAYYAQVDALEDEIKAEITKKEAELAAQIEAERKKAAEEEARRKAAEEAARRSSGSSSSSSSSSSGASAYGNGYFIWPCPSCYGITSDYGYRVHPISGAYRFHSGVDIGGGYGASILAADRGTVISAYYHWSYGNMVMISHGNGYVTLYAHMSSIAVSSGQTVSQGQVIGYVGSTGDSTGPHLHFEVRYNGNYCDPLDYLSGYGYFFY